MSRSLKVSIYGHSFVSRLSQFVEAHCEHFNLGLDPAQFTVSLYGLGGLSLHHRNLTSFDMAHKYDVMHSDIIYIDLGSNDACRLPVPPEDQNLQQHIETVKELAERLISFILRKKYSLGIRLVVVGQILHRFIEPYQGYNENVNILNRHLKCIIDQLSNSHNIFFWRHQCGLWGLDQDVYQPDGTHLSWHRGYPKYYCSVRDCILRMKNKL